MVLLYIRYISMLINAVNIMPPANTKQIILIIVFALLLYLFIINLHNFYILIIYILT